MDAFTQEREYFRLVGTLYLSEDGLFKKLPEDMAAAYIEAETVYVVVFVTRAGSIRVQSFANPAAMDDTRKKGGPVQFGERTLYTDEGPGSTALVLRRVDNPHLSSSLKSTAASMFAMLERATAGKWYE